MIEPQLRRGGAQSAPRWEGCALRTVLTSLTHLCSCTLTHNRSEASLSDLTLINVQRCQDKLRPTAAIASWQLAGGIHGLLCCCQERMGSTVIQTRDQAPDFNVLHSRALHCIQRDIRMDAIAVKFHFIIFNWGHPAMCVGGTSQPASVPASFRSRAPHSSSAFIRLWDCTMHNKVRHRDELWNKLKADCISPCRPKAASDATVPQ